MDDTHIHYYRRKNLKNPPADWLRWSWRWGGWPLGSFPLWPAHPAGSYSSASPAGGRTRGSCLDRANTEAQTHIVQHTRSYRGVCVFRQVCVTCGFASILFTPSTRCDRNFARSALLKRDLRTEAIWTRHDNTCTQTHTRTVKLHASVCRL